MKDIDRYISEKNAVNEALRSKDFLAAQNLMREYFEKSRIYSMLSLESVAINGKRYRGNLVFTVKDNTAAYVLWTEGANMADSTSVAGICFFDNAVEAIHQSNIDGLGTLNSKVNIVTNGVSIAKLLPLVKDVLLGNIPMDEKSIKKELDGYQMFESEEQSCNIVTEDILADMENARNLAYRKLRKLRKNGATPEEIRAAEEEHERTKSALREAKIHIYGGSKVTFSSEDAAEIDAVQNDFSERLDPQKRFKHMENYVNMVLKGISNGLIISGAPGIGKTHRVKKLIKSTGYDLGDNYQLITGRCTTPALYLGLYNFSREDDITLIDDCDDVMTDMNSVNILKAALEAGDERVISYFVSRPPEVSEEEAVMRHPELVPDRKGKYWAPNQFEYNGRIILITNIFAGQIDTALKNRCVICNLDFTTEETLGIVKDIMPVIMPNKLDNASKDLAYKFLCELSEKNAEMEISIRSFTTIAKIYAVCGDTEDARWMCAEQMKLQFAKPGKRKRY